RHTVHAVAQTRHWRAVIEDMAEMTAASGAMDRSPDHAQRGVVRRADRIVVAPRPKTEPTRAALELGLGRKPLPHATRAGDGPRPMLRQAAAGERSLGRTFAEHNVLFRGQERAPLGIGVSDGKPSSRCRSRTDPKRA